MKDKSEWKKYEEDIFNLLKIQYPDSVILDNHKIKGKYSKRKRQLDVLVEGFVAGRKFRQVVECKHFNKKIDVKIVESILGFLDDVNADRAIIITNKGYTKSAYLRAHNDPRFIELQICSLKELNENQGLYALSYRGKNGLIIKAPMGWINDNSALTEENTCTLYPRIYNISEAINKDFIMVNIFDKKFNEIKDLETFQKGRNKIAKKASKIQIEEIDTVKRNDAKVTLDKIVSESRIQFSGYIEFENFITTIDLMFPSEEESNRLPIIEQLLFETKQYDTIFESDVDAAIFNMLQHLDSIEQKEEKKEFLKYMKNMLLETEKELPGSIKVIEKYYDDYPELKEIK